MFSFGLILIALAILAAFAQPLALKKKYNAKFPIIILLITGFSCMLWSRVTAVNAPFGINMQTVVDKATGDAQEIANLKTRVEDQSATVDAIAEKARIAGNIASAAQSKLSETERSLETVRNTISRAQETLDFLRNEADFFELIVDAEGDDRRAVDSLRKIAVDTKNNRSARALNAWLNAIATAFSAFEYAYPVVWANNIDSSKTTIDDIKKSYYNQPLYQNRLGLIQYASTRTDISEKERRSFLLDIVKNETSLKCEALAYRKLAPNIRIDLEKVEIEPSIESLSK